MGKDTELMADDEVCWTIVEKFEALGGIVVSYAGIAKVGLATKVRLLAVPTVRMCYSTAALQLLDHEAKCSDQVPLLPAI